MMLSNLFIVKLILTPLIIAMASSIARRWGEAIGGIIVGLPLTSGPVSVFFAIEQGRTFAAGAAKGAILGLIPVAVFSTSYVLVSKRWPWYTAALAGVSLYLVAVSTISLFTPSLLTVAILVPTILVAALLLIGHVPAGGKPITSTWWDLPMRMGVATSILLAITGAASALGPTWSGLLSPFPIFTFVMATFSHRQGGKTAAWRLIRGVLTGLFSYTAFFIVVALLVEHVSLPLVYILATLTALGLNSLSLARSILKSRGTKSYSPGM